MHDAIVIGGLMAACLLAGVAGKKVAVLEKHTEPGGLTHVFRRDGASWDADLHYIDEVGLGTHARASSTTCPAARCAGTGCPTARQAPERRDVRSEQRCVLCSFMRFFA